MKTDLAEPYFPRMGFAVSHLDKPSSPCAYFPTHPIN
jgi:hypothetical protein